MRQNLRGLGRKFMGRALVEDAVFRRVAVIRIAIVERDVRIGDRRLIEVLVDAAATASELGFKFDRDTRPVINFVPFDAVFFPVSFGLLFVGRNVFAFTFAVEYLGFVSFR